MNSELTTIVDIRTEQGATGDGYLQVILTGEIDLVPSDFLL